MKMPTASKVNIDAIEIREHASTRMLAVSFEKRTANGKAENRKE
jgi:hypothetical protein